MGKKIEELNQLVSVIKCSFVDFEEESTIGDKLNKAAQRRARVLSNDISKLLKKFRELSIEVYK